MYLCVDIQPFEKCHHFRRLSTGFSIKQRASWPYVSFIFHLLDYNKTYFLLPSPHLVKFRRPSPYLLFTPCRGSIRIFPLKVVWRGASGMLCAPPSIPIHRLIDGTGPRASPFLFTSKHNLLLRVDFDVLLKLDLVGYGRLI